MRVMQFSAYGGPEVLQEANLPLPQAGPGELRVRLSAAGVAPIDTKLRAGRLQAHFRLDLPKTPGRDGAGVVDQLGDGVAGISIGDSVCVLADASRGGTYAQAIVCAAERVLAQPAGLSVQQAAALLQPGLSAWIAVMEMAQVRSGMRVLVHGGAGAVGSLMVQLCRHLGAQVSATCRAGNQAYVLGLGAARAFAYDREGFDALGGQDVVFDLIGGATHERSYAVMRRGGQIVYLVAAPFTDRGNEFGVRVTRAAITDRPQVLRELARLAGEGVLRPRVAGVFPLAEAAKAHAMLEQGHVTRGRLVLTIGQDDQAA